VRPSAEPPPARLMGSAGFLDLGGEPYPCIYSYMHMYSCQKPRVPLGHMRWRSALDSPRHFNQSQSLSPTLGWVGRPLVTWPSAPPTGAYTSNFSTQVQPGNRSRFGRSRTSPGRAVSAISVVPGSAAVRSPGRGPGKKGALVRGQAVEPAAPSFASAAWRKLWKLTTSAAAGADTETGTP
jgi:hypothetical protein